MLGTRGHRSKLTLRGFLSLVALIGMACSTADDPVPSTARPEPTAADRPVSNEVLTATSQTGRVARLNIAIPQDGNNVTPYTVGDSTNDYLLGLVYDKLFSPSPYVSRPEPWLAESISKADDYTWIIKLRSGVKWHDGKPFTAEDVKFTLEFMRDGTPTRWAHHVSSVPKVSEVIVDDPLTLRVICDGPCPTFDVVTAADIPILPKHLWQRVAEPRKFTQELAVGTGPYVLVEHVPDQFYRFEANEEYFKGRPMADELVMPIIKDPSTTFIALKTGEVDAAVRALPPELLDEFRTLKDFKAVRTASLSVVEAVMNIDKFPYEVKEFRKAVSLAIDRQAVLDTVALGRGIPASTGYFHPDSPWAKPGIHIPFDPAESRTLLDDLGFADQDGDGFREDPYGRQFVMSINVPANEPTRLRAWEMVTTQLSEVGLRAKVVSLDPGAHAEAYQSRTFDFWDWAGTPHSTSDPDQWIQSNWGGFLWRKDKPYPEMHDLIQRWLQSDNVEQRRELGFQMQQLFSEFPAAIDLYFPDQFYAFRPDAYDLWADSPGYGIVHKWSLLPPDSRGGTVISEFGSN
jgi:peptide/nickel transport system substrate-binding protein